MRHLRYDTGQRLNFLVLIVQMAKINENKIKYKYLLQFYIELHIPCHQILSCYNFFSPHTSHV